jgi:hypothetical protein
MMHLDDQAGSIKGGKSADMVVISQKLFEIEPMEIYNTKPLKTVFQGKVVYESSE